MKAHLILKDGTLFRGQAPLGFGGQGEVVFTTSMMGYQEILTDPSYGGQMITMTFPEQGIYGIHTHLNQGVKPSATGFICRRMTLRPDHAQSEQDLQSWLRSFHIPVITDVDTRALTQHLRDQGSQPGLIWLESEGDVAHGVQKAKELPDMTGQSLCGQASCRDRYEMANPNAPFRVSVLDGGIKQSILDQLHASGLALEVFPWDTPAKELAAPRFHGIFLSNGPGDPASLSGMMKEVEQCIGQKPIFGICLGHQLLGHAFGGKTFKLKFGHRGANQPVIDLATGKIEITSQNHGFAVDDMSLPPEIEITHRHLSDNTVEGLRHKTLPIFSIQHHPEASPGPHDARHSFGKFKQLMEDFHA